MTEAEELEGFLESIIGSMHDPKNAALLRNARSLAQFDPQVLMARTLPSGEIIKRVLAVFEEIESDPNAPWRNMRRVSGAYAMILARIDALRSAVPEQ